MDKFRKLMKDHGAVCTVVLSVLVCVMAVIAFLLAGMLDKAEEKYSAYRTDAEVRISELEKEKNAAAISVSDMQKQLGVMQAEKEELSDIIAEKESEIKVLDVSYRDGDELYGKLTEELNGLKALLEDKEKEIDQISAKLNAMKKSGDIDLSVQSELLDKLKQSLSEEAPMNSEESAKLDENGNVILNGGRAEKYTTYSYPAVSLYYKDLASGYMFSWNENRAFPAAGCGQVTFALSLLKAASDEQAEIEKMNAEYIEKNGKNAKLPYREKVYDFGKIFVYSEESYNSGLGVIKNKSYGTEYTHLQLIETMLKYGDVIAYNELKAVYGTSLQTALVKKLGLKTMKSDLNTVTASELASVMKEVYAFTESDAYYADFMRECMEKSAQTAMLASSVTSKKLLNSFGVDNGAYHYSCVICGDHPYILVILSDMDSGNDEVNSYIKKLVSCVDKLHGNFYK